MIIFTTCASLTSLEAPLEPVLFPAVSLHLAWKILSWTKRFRTHHSIAEPLEWTTSHRECNCNKENEAKGFTLKNTQRLIGKEETTQGLHKTVLSHEHLSQSASFSLFMLLSLITNEVPSTQIYTVCIS